MMYIMPQILDVILNTEEVDRMKMNRILMKVLGTYKEWLDNLNVYMVNRIYLVLYNAYKLGDLECRGSRPLFVSHDKNDTINFFKNNVQECKDLFVDFETEEETETSFIFNNGKWKYEWSLNSIPLDTDLTL